MAKKQSSPIERLRSHFADELKSKTDIFEVINVLGDISVATIALLTGETVNRGELKDRIPNTSGYHAVISEILGIPNHFGPVQTEATPPTAEIVPIN